MQKKYAFDTVTLVKILKGAGIAGLGASLTYLAQYVGQIDFGVFAPLVVALLSVAVNAVKEWTSGE
ncbi:hypothetical protein HY346_03300 [Candidatus Microgenomates bacterium]|nr:hypothetical protein [Candidatus Microgenomates bacterium]